MARKPVSNKRMPRRCGISFIQNSNSRSITFFKRRHGLYKAAADLCTLTGAKVAVVLESETGKMSSFGTPSAAPIIDSYLSGTPLVDPFVNKDEKSRITQLQNELFEVERVKSLEEKKSKDYIARAQEIQETSRKAKLVYSDVEDLSLEELYELKNDLSRVLQEINGGLPPQQPSYLQLGAGGSGDPSPWWLSSSSPPSHSQIQLPPRRLPWTSKQPSSSSQLQRSPWSLPQPSSLQPPLPNPSMLQAPPMPPLLQHNSSMPQHPLTGQPQPQMMISPNGAYQHNYDCNTQMAHIGGNISQPFSQSSLLCALPPTPPPPPSSSPQFVFYNEFHPSSSSQQPPTPLALEAELHPPAEQPENTQNFTADHPLANHQWPSPICSNEPYHGLDFFLGDHNYYGGQAAGDPNMPGPSGLNQQPFGFPHRNFSEPSEEEE